MHLRALPAYSPSTSRRASLLVALGYLVLYAAWLLLGAGSEGERWLVGNLALAFPGLAAALLAWHTQRQAEPGSSRRAWNLLFTGLLLWTISSLAWMQAEDSNLVVAPLLSRVCHAAAYLAIFGGLLAYPRRARRGFTPLRQVVEMAISSLGVLTLGWLVLVQPVLSSSASADSPLIWSAIYPSLDVVLLVALVNIFIITQPRRLDNALKWIGLGLAAITASDMVYSFWVLQNPYTSGGLTDLGWVIGYCALALAALEASSFSNTQIRVTAESLPGQPGMEIEGKQSRFWHNLEERLQSSFPLVAAFVLGWYTVLNWQIRGQIDTLGLGMTVLLTLGLVARQGIVAGERELQQYAMLVSSIAVPAFICDGKGRLKLANPALLASIGYQAGNDLLEQPVLNLFAANTLPRDLLALGLSRGWSGETQLRRRDGGALPVYLSLRPIQRTASERLALAGTAYDLTDQKQQQAALQSAYEQITAAHSQLENLNEQLEQKVTEKTLNLSQAYSQLEEQNRSLQKLDELKSDFVSLVSHELRAPLTNINGGIELVLNHPKGMPESTRGSLTLVQAEIRRLTRFVESILDLSALDAGRVPLYPGPLNLSEVTIPLRRQLDTLPGAERVSWQIPETTPPVIADDHALSSIFFHLIDNAVKYAPEGPVRVHAWPEDGKVFVQVADQGPGIPAEALDLVFEKFYRFHYGDAQTVYGHGLGLYMVRRLLQAMGGEIKVENLPGGGAAFTFWLPAFEE
jgi:PAS domain S-box-containing protein